MKEIFADLRDIPRDDPTDFIADHPARVALECVLHENVGNFIRIRITKFKYSKGLPPINEENELDRTLDKNGYYDCV